jgi:hypothetical protein
MALRDQRRLLQDTRGSSSVRMFSYVVRWDHGFAPNPFFNICSLATCKPQIRAVAAEGDYILGTGTSTRSIAGKLVFIMKIEKIISFDEYWNDTTYVRKIPVMNGSLQQRFGDNIYHRENGKWMQADSRHSGVGAKSNYDNLKRDTGSTDRVLLSESYSYWGGEGPRVPSRLSHFVHSSPGHRAFFTAADITRFLDWIGTNRTKGRVSDPIEWKYESRWR